VFLVMALGYAAGHTREFDGRSLGSLNALVMDFALPAALFTAMAQTSRAAMIAQAQLALVVSAAMLAAFGLTYLIQSRLFGADPRESALMALTSSGPNVGSAGLPIVAALISMQASVSVAVAVAVAAVVLTPLSLLLLEATTGKNRGTLAVCKDALLKPIVVAPVLGLVSALSGISLPPILDGTLTLVGQGASGTALFLTGLVLSAQPFRFSADVGLAAAVKNLLQPVLTALLALPLLSGEDARVAVMLMAVPSGAFGVLFAVRFNVASVPVGTTLIVSTVAGAVTLTAAILLSAGWKWT
jgi:malonate transporter